MNLVTPKAGAKHEPLFNKPVSDKTRKTNSNLKLPAGLGQNLCCLLTGTSCGQDELASMLISLSFVIYTRRKNKLECFFRVAWHLRVSLVRPQKDAPLRYSELKKSTTCYENGKNWPLRGRIPHTPRVLCTQGWVGLRGWWCLLHLLTTAKSFPGRRRVSLPDQDYFV
jgi:hypothetical protein